MRVAAKAGTDISQGKRRMCMGLKQKNKGNKGKNKGKKRKASEDQGNREGYEVVLALSCGGEDGWCLVLKPRR